MAVHDCEFCESLYNCRAQISSSLDFYTFASKMLCEIADNTGGFGPVDAFNLVSVGGVAVTIADFQDLATVGGAAVTIADFQNLATIGGAAVTIADFQNLATIGGAAVTIADLQQGNVAHDAADSGNPLKIGFRARTSDITAVANDDRTDAIADKIGRQVTSPYAIPEDSVRGTTGDIVDTTSTQVIAAQAGSLRTYITSITVSNMSDSVMTRVDILDGASVIWQGPAAMNGGGYTITFPVPLKGSAATAVNAQCGTTGALVRVSAAGYIGV